MNKKITEIYNEIRRKNNQIIEEGKKVAPFGFIIGKNYKVAVIGFNFENSKEKALMREAFKRMVLSKDVIGYMIIFDTYMTSLDKKTGEREVFDVIVRNLYTPKKAILEFVKYKDNKIVEVIDMSKDEAMDEWNFWGKGFDENDEKLVKENKEYQKFKEENPEKFKEINNG